ncbi:MAG: AMP-binding protein [Acidobacteriota bacterium]
MNQLDLYHALPYPLKVVAASARGLQLRGWRYGAETERLVREALARDGWSAAQWAAYQERRLATVLTIARHRVPAYRRLWRGRTGDPTRLRDWPLLDKDALRADPESFLVEGLDRRRLYREGTSGSSGTPLSLWFRRETVRFWYALVEARSRRWHGVNDRDRWAILGGQLVARPGRARPPYWVWNAALRQLYLSAFHLGPRSADAYVAAMADHGVRHLYGYTAALDTLAREIGDRSAARALDLAVVITNAEPLLAHQRARIEEVFGAPVRENYGMAELVAAASECEEGRLHWWPEVGVAEVLDDDLQPVAPGEAGELIATGLLGDVQPLIRYRVGDRVTAAPPDTRCPCGRSLPILDRVEGRHEEAIATLDGRKVNRFDAVFKGRLPVREAQIEQVAADRVVVRLVIDEGYDARAAALVRARMHDRIGRAMTVDLEPVERIERGPNGKFQMVRGLRTDRPSATEERE